MVINMGEEALRYASRGRKVFPCTINKRPITDSGFKDATTDQKQVKEWWEKHPDASIGAPTGNGWFVLDIDLPDGQAELDKLELENEPLPATREQRTGSGGRHLFFSVDCEISNSAGKLGKNIDIRGDGGYIILTPSNHESGNRYEWVNEAPIEKAPDWLIEKLNRPKEKERTPTPTQGRYGQKALAAELAELTGTGEGSRNHKLNQAAYSLSQLVAGGELGRGQVEAALLSAAVSIGLSNEEAQRTIQSGFEAGLRAPRIAPARQIETAATPERPHTPVISAKDEDIINQLISMSPLDYDRVRESKAAELGIRVSVLDKEVNRIRQQTTPDSGEMFPAIDSWPEPVDGKNLVADLCHAFQDYSVLPAGSAMAMALWTLLTYCYDLFRVLPILLISSPEKRCGKSTTLTTLEGLVSRSLTASNISPAAMFRAVEAFKPTLLIDEGDTFLKQNDDLRGIINSGHTKTSAYVLRCEGESNEPKRFSTWCPKALAMIGAPPDTIFDRSVVVPLRRKMAGESVKHHGQESEELFQELRQKITRFVEDNDHAIKTSRPPRLQTGNDRQADNWNPLLSIAAAVSSECLQNAVDAAMVLIGHVDDEEPPTIQLLGDIKSILSGDRISSDDLVQQLINMEDRPWCEWKHGKPMTKTSLSRLLRPFGIKSKSIRFTEKVVRGFEKSDFDDALARYLPTQSATTLQANDISYLGQFESATQKNVVALSKRDNYTKSLRCSSVALSKGGVVGEHTKDAILTLRDDDFIFDEEVV